jgi:membrane protease YdiL (CAAX protease family)
LVPDWFAVGYSLYIWSCIYITHTMIKELILFYKDPYSFLNSGVGEPMNEQLRVMKFAFVFCLASTLTISLLLAFIESILSFGFNISVLKNLSTKREEFHAANTAWNAVVKVVVMAPFVEEFLFRWLLVTKSRIINAIIFTFLLEHIFQDVFQLHISSWWYMLIILLIFIAVVAGDSLSGKHYLPVFERNGYNYLCWALTLAFALAHVGNFAPLNWSLFYIYPIYVLPQFVYGIVSSYLAVRYNSVVWPFLLHAAINLTAEVLTLLRGML